MKLKNVKVGVKVQLKEDLPSHPSLKKGMTGTIIEGDYDCPCISWDNFTGGVNGVYCNQTRIKLGLPENSVWSVDIKYLKRTKE